MPTTRTTTFRYQAALLALAICLALGLRLAGLFWGLPTETLTLRSYHPDEGPFMQSLKYIATMTWPPPPQSGNGMPHLLTMALVYKAGELAGQLTLSMDRAFLLANLPLFDRWYIVGRLLSVFEGVLCVPLLWAVGRRFYDARTGLIAAFLFAVTALHVVDSQYIYPGGPVVFWGLLAWWFLARLQTAPEITRGDLAGAGLFTAVATMVQYNAAIFLCMLPVTLWLRRRTGLAAAIPWRRVVLWAGGAFVIGFLVSAPNAWLDPVSFARHVVDFSHEHFVQKTRAAAANFQGSAFAFYGAIAPLEGLGTVLYLAVVAGLALAAWRRTAADIWLLIFLLLYVLMLSRNNIYISHYLLVLLPAVVLAAAAALARIPARGWRWLTVGLVVASAAGYCLAYDALFLRPDARTQVSEWLQANVPAGTKIGVNEIYFYSAPVLQRADSPYRVVRYYFDRAKLAAEPPEYFVLNEFELGIAGSLLYPEAHPELRPDLFLREVLEGGRFRLVHEFHQPLELFGIDWTPRYDMLVDFHPVVRPLGGLPVRVDVPSWHWRYPQPRVWLLRRSDEAAR